MINVSIIGASGYTGSELMRFLVNHPQVQLQDLTSRTYVGQAVASVFPNLTGYLDQDFVELDLDSLVEKSDLVFICLPHGHSMQIAKTCLEAGVKVIDLGADFRLRDQATYEEVYQVKQEAPEILEKAVYGWSESYREELKDAEIVANPGCFVVTSLLGLKAAVANNLIDNQSIIIDAKTGVSGAGRGAKVDNLYAELTGSIKAYNPLHHRHIPEIEQELKALGNDDTLQVQFTPHLAPMERGILATIYGDLKEGVSEEEVRQAYLETYADEPFVHILPEGQLPTTKAVRGTNHCHIQVQVDHRTNRLVILSAADNLGKGAATQAIQNMNIMFGLDEKTGINQTAVLP